VYQNSYRLVIWYRMMVKRNNIGDKQGNRNQQLRKWLGLSRWTSQAVLVVITTPGARQQKRTVVLTVQNVVSLPLHLGGPKGSRCLHLLAEECPGKGTLSEALLGLVAPRLSS